MKKLLLFTLSLALAIIFATGCKKDEQDTIPDPNPNLEPTEEYIVSDNTVIIDEDARKAILEIDTTNFQFIFDGSSDIVDSLKVGDILVDSSSEKAPYGYLRKVKSINTNKGGETVVLTESATLVEAINKGHINFNTGKLTMANVERYELAEGVRLKNAKNTDFTVFSLDYEKVFTNEYGEVTISGHTDLELEYFFDFDWDWELLPYPHAFVKKFESGVEINQSASISVYSEAGAGMQERVSLAKFYFMPWTFSVGPVPVVFVPRIELFVEMDGSIVAVLTSSASESLNGRLGTRYRDGHGWSKISEKEYEKDFVAPNLTAGADFTAHIGPDIALLLYGIAGPFADLTACGQVNAFLHTESGNWDLEFKVGVRSRVGVIMDIIGFRESWTPEEYCLFEETLMHLNNEPFGNNIYISYPVDGNSYLVGDIITVTTSYTGETPDEVDFYYDNNLVYTDNEEPFEYVLTTSGETEGEHVVSVSAKIDGIEIANDDALFNLITPVWDILELSDAGLSVNTNANDLFFNSTTDGWMTVESNTGTGMILKTNDAGYTWENIKTISTPLRQVIMFNSSEGIFLAGDGRVMFTDNGGYDLEELSYGQYDRPSFQWNDVFGLATNSDGEIVAVTKDEGIPYYFKVGRANIASHNPAGYFNLPYPNEYGLPPKIVMNGNTGFLYNVYHEDQPNKSYFMSTTDGGVSWQGFEVGSVDANTHLYGAHMPDETHVWIVGEDINGAVVIMSDNGGESWTTVGLTGTPGFSSVYFTSNDIGYATVKDDSGDDFEPKLYKTLDGGHTWSPMIDTKERYGMSSVFFLGQDFGVVCGKGPYVFRYSVN